MISFIVIGRNEQEHIARCLDSILFVTNSDCVKSYEIIYVDSNSSDNSLNILASYPYISVYQISGKCNAAAGRTVGAQHATGDVLFFIDADMELLPGFISSVTDHGLNLKYDLVRGNLRNIFNYRSHDYHTTLFNTNKLKSFDKLVFPAGMFMIKREVWNVVNGFRTRYVICEEMDMGLRLVRKGIWTTYINIIMANHYTIDHNNTTIKMQELIAGKLSYRGVLYRNHLFSTHMYKFMASVDYTAILLVLCVTFALVDIRLLIVYPIAVFLRVLYQKLYLPSHVLIRMLYYALRDICILSSFIGFYPKNFNIVYKRIQ